MKEVEKTILEELDQLSFFAISTSATTSFVSLDEVKKVIRKAFKRDKKKRIY